MEDSDKESTPLLRRKKTAEKEVLKKSAEMVVKDVLQKPEKDVLPPPLESRTTGQVGKTGGGDDPSAYARARPVKQGDGKVHPVKGLEPPLLLLTPALADHNRGISAAGSTAVRQITPAKGHGPPAPADHNRGNSAGGSTAVQQTAPVPPLPSLELKPGEGKAQPLKGPAPPPLLLRPAPPGHNMGNSIGTTAAMQQLALVPQFLTPELRPSEGKAPLLKDPQPPPLLKQLAPADHKMGNSPDESPAENDIVIATRTFVSADLNMGNSVGGNAALQQPAPVPLILTPDPKSGGGMGPALRDPGPPPLLLQPAPPHHNMGNTTRGSALGQQLAPPPHVPKLHLKLGEGNAPPLKGPVLAPADHEMGNSTGKSAAANDTATAARPALAQMTDRLCAAGPQLQIERPSEAPLPLLPLSPKSTLLPPTDHKSDEVSGLGKVKDKVNGLVKAMAKYSRIENATSKIKAIMNGPEVRQHLPCPDMHGRTPNSIIIGLPPRNLTVRTTEHSGVDLCTDRSNKQPMTEGESILTPHGLHLLHQQTGPPHPVDKPTDTAGFREVVSVVTG
ncbi:hypothetical protein CBR_g31537 [Chara braunii]|uniref:Uncharacterized protein n=1 Tax=Chara braunii TaxID=69332 RepID=A0A388LFA9_CHABU|nr:hypothetical protein CBR_g31537 [Chara braunii]|eukprot:GBG80981.1 hypothetical protein CBR_g31537 [Chara braunii]